MDFTTRLTTWLTCHPLKEPTDMDPARYTAEVMTKITAVDQPRLLPAHHWFPWPRLALAIATAAAGIVVVMMTTHSTSQRLAEHISRDSQLLAVLDPDTEPLIADHHDAEALAQEMETMDTVVLAESQPSDDQWIDQTVQLLDQLDQDIPADASSDGSSTGTDWIEELEQLDEHDLSSSS